MSHRTRSLGALPPILLHGLLGYQIAGFLPVHTCSRIARVPGPVQPHAREKLTKQSLEKLQNPLRRQMASLWVSILCNWSQRHPTAAMFVNTPPLDTLQDKFESSWKKLPIFAKKTSSTSKASGAVLAKEEEEVEGTQSPKRPQSILNAARAPTEVIDQPTNPSHPKSSQGSPRASRRSFGRRPGLLFDLLLDSPHRCLGLSGR